MKQVFSISKLSSLILLSGLMALASRKKDNNINNSSNPDPALAVDAA